MLPCFTYTPPSLGIEAKASSPPRDAKAYADFLDVIVGRHGRGFEWVELWNEPNNLNNWDWQLDFEWHVFSAMVGGAAYWMRSLGKKTVLGGTCPTDPHWLHLMCQRGVMAYVDAIGVHGFPGTWDSGGGVARLAGDHRGRQACGRRGRVRAGALDHRGRVLDLAP